MKITAIIEKGTDGKYSVRSDDSFDKYYFGGFGDSVAEAKQDFIESVDEAIADALPDGEPMPEYSVQFKYDLPSFFNDFDFINATRFAQISGINESKMRQYKSGASHPGERTVKKILDTVHRIGAELSSVSI